MPEDVVMSYGADSEYLPDGMKGKPIEDEDEEDEEEEENEDDFIDEDEEEEEKDMKEAKPKSDNSKKKKAEPEHVGHKDVDEVVDLTDGKTHWIDFKTVLRRGGINDPYHCRPVYHGRISETIIKGVCQIAAHLMKRKHPVITSYCRKPVPNGNHTSSCVCIPFEEWPAAADFMRNNLKQRNRQNVANEIVIAAMYIPPAFHANTKLKPETRLRNSAK